MRDEFSIVVMSDAEDENFQHVVAGITPLLGNSFYRFNVTSTTNVSND